MADVKWIKITTTMFDDDKIKLIDAMPERDTIFYIWMRLLVQAGKTNTAGYIFLNENVPYTEEMLSTIFNRQIGSVRLALQTLKSFGMIEISDNHLIKITNWGKHQNIDKLEKMKEQTRQRVANHRSKKKELMQPSEEEICGGNEGCNVTETLRNDTEEEREKDIEEDIEEDIEREREEEISLIDESLEVCKYFEAVSNGKSIMQFMNDIKLLIDMYSKSWVLEAIDITVSKHVYSLPFIKKILRNWVNDGKKRGGNGGSSGENTKSSSSELYDFSKYGGKRN